MQTYLKIGAFDCTPFLASGGLSQNEVSRQCREVVTLDGYLQRGEVIKRTLSVEFVTLRDTTWYAVCAALRDRPVTVSYLDDDKGTISKRFYVSGKSSGAKTVLGGITYFQGCSFVLEEV